MSGGLCVEAGQSLLDIVFMIFDLSCLFVCFIAYCFIYCCLFLLLLLDLGV